MKITVLGRIGGQFVDRGIYVMFHMQSDNLRLLKGAKLRWHSALALLSKILFQYKYRQDRF
jgi:hypothetical protein